MKGLNRPKAKQYRDKIEYWGNLLFFGPSEGYSAELMLKITEYYNKPIAKYNISYIVIKDLEEYKCDLKHVNSLKKKTSSKIIW